MGVIRTVSIHSCPPTEPAPTGPWISVYCLAGNATGPWLNAPTTTVVNGQVFMVDPADGALGYRTGNTVTVLMVDTYQDKALHQSLLANLKATGGGC